MSASLGAKPPLPGGSAIGIESVAAPVDSALGALSPCRGAADAQAQPRILRRSEMQGDGLQPVVPPIAPSRAPTQPPEWQVHIIADHEQVRQVDPVVPREGRHGLAAHVHMAAAMPQNYIAFEYPYGQPEWWYDIVEGLPNPIVNKGFIDVWDRPGLGVTFKVTAAKARLADEDRKFFD